MSRVVGRVSGNVIAKVSFFPEVITKATHHEDIVFTHLIFVVINATVVQVRVGGVRLFVPVRVE